MILDALRTQLQLRIELYQKLNDRFYFITDLNNLSLEEIEEKAKNLILIYPNDLNNNLIIECQHFTSYL